MPGRDNINTWKEWTNLNFPLLYVSKWIPFNAWYVSIVGSKEDRECINFFKSHTDNDLYNRIKELLQDSRRSYDRYCFQHEFRELDKILDNNSFPSVNEQLKFGITEMSANPTKESSIRLNGFQYKVTRYEEGDDEHIPNKTIKTIVQNLRDNTIVQFTIPKHKEDDYIEKLRTQNIRGEKKKILIKLFHEVEPIIHVDIKNKKNGRMKIADGTYCNNKDAICAAIVHVLYELRCKAVHGEISIQPIVPSIYSHAYNMLNIITKNLF